MNTKSLIQSKSFWLASAQFAVGLLALITTSFGAYIPAAALGAIAMLKSVVDIYLRMNTKTEIGSVV